MTKTNSSLQWYEVRARAGYALLAERVQAANAEAAIRETRMALLRAADGRPLKCVRAVLDE